MYTCVNDRRTCRISMVSLIGGIKKIAVGGFWQFATEYNWLTLFFCTKTHILVMIEIAFVVQYTMQNCIVLASCGLDSCWKSKIREL